VSKPATYSLGLLLALVLTALQIQLWWGESGWFQMRHTSQQTRLQKASNHKIEERNNRLGAEIVVLQDPGGAGLDTVEGLARQEMGMVRADETFLLLPAPRLAHRRLE